MSERPRAYWMPVLHAHLPFVRHPEFNDPIEERWLHEAVVECYLPLLEVVRGWRRDGVPYRLTLSFSPPVVAMLDDGLLRARTRRYLESRVELAEAEVFRTRALSEQHKLALFYRERLGRLLGLYNEIKDDVAGAFADEARVGGLELLTCTATHAFLPLLQPQPQLIKLQVQLGAEAFRRRFGVAANGLWNAECGYFRGLDREFAAAGLNFFFVDAHAIEHAGPRPRWGLATPLRCPAGPAAFGRDPQTSREVWNAQQGYPGDPAYREFHRDIGYDLEFEYIKPYIHESGLRLATGLKYHAVTGTVTLGEKAWYDPEAARARVAVHAADFVAKRHAQARDWEANHAGMDRPPLITSPYDAELLGHWWFEGPEWLGLTMRGMCERASEVAPVTPSEYLERHGELQRAEPAFSSWGEGGYGGVWLAEHNRWIYPLLDRAGEELLAAVARYREEFGREGTQRALRTAKNREGEMNATNDCKDEELARRALNQFARELLLAQSSDWAFLITMGTAPEYAEKRTREHLGVCEKLGGELASGKIDQEFLKKCEEQYTLFAWFNVMDFF